MKPTSRLFTSRKIVLGAVSLLSLASVATGAPYDSILDEARYGSDSFFMDRSILSPTASLLGAITLDDVYKFDYATAGIGTLTFRSGAKRPVIDTPIQDMPRSEGTVNSADQSSDFFVESSGFIGRSGGFSVGDDSVDSGFNPPTAVPEPSTWMAGIFALGVIAFMQRRRLHGIIGRRA